LLEDKSARDKMAANALKRIRDQFSWEEVARRFEQTFVEACNLL
jgi:glycosyltransferase involved in cell wall biosynthesis